MSNAPSTAEIAMIGKLMEEMNANEQRDVAEGNRKIMDSFDAGMKEAKNDPELKMRYFANAMANLFQRQASWDFLPLVQQQLAPSEEHIRRAWRTWLDSAQVADINKQDKDRFAALCKTMLSRPVASLEASEDKKEQQKQEQDKQQAHKDASNTAEENRKLLERYWKYAEKVLPLPLEKAKF